MGNFKSRKETNILLISEDNVLIEIFNKTIENLNINLKYKINLDIVYSGKAAVRRFKNKSYDLILIDNNLKDSTGYILIKKYRRIELKRFINKRTPVIGFSAEFTQSSMEIFLQAGFDMCFNKPITQKIITEIICNFIR